MKKKFNKNPFVFVYNFMCAQTALNVLFGAMIIIIVWSMISMREKVILILQHDNSTPSVVTDKIYKDINALKVQANILEAMQQRIIVNSPELYKQYDQMFSEVEVEVLEGLKREVDKTEKEMEKLDKGLKKLIPENKGLRLDLDRSGEYPI
ncbi:MAG: hypothetical protein ACTSPB_20060 [Candidatus Thorarchaeota archaeon]